MGWLFQRPVHANEESHEEVLEQSELELGPARPDDEIQVGEDTSN